MPHVEGGKEVFFCRSRIVSTILPKNVAVTQLYRACAVLDAASKKRASRLLETSLDQCIDTMGKLVLAVDECTSSPDQQFAFMAVLPHQAVILNLLFDAMLNVRSMLATSDGSMSRMSIVNFDEVLHFTHPILPI